MEAADDRFRAFSLLISVAASIASMMRATVALIAILLLAGCTAAPPVAPTPTATATAANPVTPAIYLKLMRGLSEFNNVDDTTLVGLAKDTCKVVAKKDGWLVAVEAFTLKGFDAKTAGSGIRYMVAAYCPEAQANLPAQ